jgi:hypothetical protein
MGEIPLRPPHRLPSRRPIRPKRAAISRLFAQNVKRDLARLEKSGDRSSFREGGWSHNKSGRQSRHRCLRGGPLGHRPDSLHLNSWHSRRHVATRFNATSASVPASHPGAYQLRHVVIAQQMRHPAGGSTLTRAVLVGGGPAVRYTSPFALAAGHKPRRDALCPSAAPAPSSGRTTVAWSHPA